MENKKFDLQDEFELQTLNIAATNIFIAKRFRKLLLENKKETIAERETLQFIYEQLNGGDLYYDAIVKGII